MESHHAGAATNRAPRLASPDMSHGSNSDARRTMRYVISASTAGYNTKSGIKRQSIILTIADAAFSNATSETEIISTAAKESYHNILPPVHSIQDVHHDQRHDVHLHRIHPLLSVVHEPIISESVSVVKPHV